MRIFIIFLFLSSCLTVNDDLPIPEVNCVCAEVVLLDCPIQLPHDSEFIEKRGYETD
jgi:hypothetical protein